MPLRDLIKTDPRVRDAFERGFRAGRRRGLEDGRRQGRAEMRQEWEALAPARCRTCGPKVAEAMDWLEWRLADADAVWPEPWQSVEVDALAGGIKRRTLYRAASEMGPRLSREWVNGTYGAWLELPHEIADDGPADDR
jgi:hypothetical protein